ncbi:hypothetical protein NSK_006340, partial [Nannochloropsis salina CCMP1776]
VDVDRDEVHLGVDEERNQPRQRPHLPDRELSKLRRALLECGAVEDGVVKKLHLEGGGGLSTSAADVLLGEL